MMSLSVARTLLAGVTVIVCGVIVCGAASLRAQQADGTAPQSPPSVERIRAALQMQPSITFDSASLFPPTKPTDVRVGVVTFVQPETAGEGVAVSVPIGAMVMSAIRSISAAQHRRAERAAHAEVVKVLTEFLEAQPK